RRKSYGELEQKLVKTIHRHNFENRVIISSFNPVAILGVRKTDNSLNTALIYTNWKKLPWYLRNGGGKYICKPNILKPTRYKINPFTMFITKKIEGYTVITWTEDDPLKVQKYFNLGVDGIVTNVPEIVIEVNKKYWNQKELNP
ncbi:MAG: glycerophosphodiester phosphodiesterase, partial [Spirochaetales bacterium]|nr:glycerophosphodiester phosphodiesterase [Spirochaetales bacterium]